jgi:hypothetical protein
MLSMLALAGGCSTEQKYAPAAVNTAPIVGDQAMALRSDWPKSTAYYANGSVPAFSTRFPYDVNAQRPGPGDVIIDPAMFIVQTVMLPIELIKYPPGTEQIWHGEIIPPTYTATPPLPPLGGVTTPPVMAFPFLGPQATAPDTGLPGAPATPANATSAQLPAYPAMAAPAAAAPTPPPFSPGSTTGPPVSR